MPDNPLENSNFAEAVARHQERVRQREERWRRLTVGPIPAPPSIPLTEPMTATEAEGIRERFDEIRRSQAQASARMEQIQASVYRAGNQTGRTIGGLGRITARLFDESPCDPVPEDIPEDSVRTRIQSAYPEPPKPKKLVDHGCNPMCPKCLPNVRKLLLF